MNKAKFGKKLAQANPPADRIISKMMRAGIASAIMVYLFYLIVPNIQLAICQFVLLLILCLQSAINDEIAYKTLANETPIAVQASIKVGKGRSSVEWPDEDGLASAKLVVTAGQRLKLKEVEGTPVTLLVYRDAKTASTAIGLANLVFIPRIFSHSALTTRTWPPITTVLVMANCVYFAVAAQFQLTSMQRLPTAALVNAGASLGAIDEPWRLVASSFLHLSWWHLAFNMLALIWFGRICEAKLGWARYLLLYLFCTIGSALASAAAFGGTAPSAGASGAIMGLGGFITALAYFRRDLYQSTVLRRVLISHSNIIIGAVILGLACSRLLDGVLTDNAAHCGGFLFGMLGAWIFPPTAIKKRIASCIAAAAAMNGLWYVATQKYYGGGVHQARAMLAMCRSQSRLAHAEFLQALEAEKAAPHKEPGAQKEWNIDDAICSLLGCEQKDKLTDLYNFASWTASMQANYSEGVTLGTLAISHAGGAPELDTRAIAYMGLRDYANARKDLTQALKMQPHFDAAEFHLAQVNLLDKAGAAGTKTSTSGKKFDYTPEEWEYRFGRP